ncbi:MAG: peptidoglycan-binding protein [Minisyncoccia bacterium]|jgi:hypothetical protein
MHILKKDWTLPTASLSAFLVLSLVAISFGISAHAQTVPTVALAPITGPTVTVGDIATFTASATDSDASSTIAYGLSAAPSGAIIDPTAGTFLWDTTGATPDTYTFSVTATGSTGGSDSQNVSIVVNAPVVPSDADASSTDPDLQTQVATSTDGTGGTATTTGGTVTTGDAVATSSVDNELNSNTTDPDQPGRTNSSTITSDNTNVGALDSVATSTADTGSNTVTGGTADNTIVTGDAVSTSNVINEVNTNIFNSDGLILFINQLFGGGFDINDYDLSYFFAGGPGMSETTNPTTGKPQCTLLTCLNSSSLNVLNSNTATVTNSVIVRSSTGDNTASSTGDATIDTGSAYAAANVVNLVNTNIVNSSYLLLSFNNFGDLSANITLPGNDFFQQLFANGEATSSMNSSTYAVDNVNSVDFTGTTTADATTGDNMASTTTADASTTPSGSGVVATGDAYSSANTYNQANTNDVGGTSVFMLFRVAGNWTGSVIGLPAGITESTFPDGNDQLIEFVSTGASTTLATDWLQKYNSSHFLAAATSTANVDNDVTVSADTGSNQATTDTGTSSVTTGNAYAAASVVNLINTNIVGQNWIFSVFNIFGNFSGDIVFGGSLNLSLSALTSTSNTSPSSDVTYTFTVTNSGDADASSVLLNATFDNTLLSFAPTDIDATSTPAGESWNLGLIPQGQSRTFSFTAHVGSNFPAGQSATVPLTAAVVNDSITAPSTSNTADASIVVSSPANPSTSSGSSSGGGGGGGGGVLSSSNPLSSYSNDPKLSLTKTVSIATTSATTSVDYKVVVTDDKSAGPLFNSYLTDTLTDPTGKVMMQRSWNLDTINPGDEIDLTYSIVYAATSTPGIYNNVAQVTGYKNYSGLAYGTLISPLAATGTVLFTPEGYVVASSTSEGIVLGASTSTPSITTPTSCSPLLSTFLGRGRANDAGQVMKLQQFLNDEVEAALPITGVFGPLTEGAVKAFQSKYKDQILAPLGLTAPTGIVLSATQSQINALVCNNTGLSYLFTTAEQVTSVAAPMIAPVYVPKPHIVKTPRVPQTAAAPTTVSATPAAPKAGPLGWIKNLFSF